MDSSELEEKWTSLSHDGSTEYVLKRIDSSCIPELSIAVSSGLDRSLILELPAEHMVNFESIKRKNLTLEPYASLSCIVLKLTDPTYYDLFNDLVLSLYQRLKDESDSTVSSRLFVETFHKWSEFFHDESSERLSNEVVKGLYGELFILSDLLENAEAIRTNQVLSAWVGPYDEIHDFSFDEKDIEVKTKDNKKLDVRISSEFQLESILGKPLELIVVSVEGDYVDGISLSDLVSQIRQQVTNKLGDPSILFETLKQKKLSLKNIGDYDNYRFKVVEKTTYNCLMDGFPRLVKSKLPDSIANIQYSLNTSSLSDFLISREKF